MKKFIAVFKNPKVQTVGLALATVFMFLIIGYALLGGFTQKDTAEGLTPDEQVKVEKIQADRAEYYAKKEPVELTTEQKNKVKLFDAEWAVLRLANE